MLSRSISLATHHARSSGHQRLGPWLCGHVRAIARSCRCRRAGGSTRDRAWRTSARHGTPRSPASPRTRTRPRTSTSRRARSPRAERVQGDRPRRPGGVRSGVPCPRAAHRGAARRRRSARTVQADAWHGRSARRSRTTARGCPRGTSCRAMRDAGVARTPRSHAGRARPPSPSGTTAACTPSQIRDIAAPRSAVPRAAAIRSEASSSANAPRRGCSIAGMRQPIDSIQWPSRAASRARV